jgi:hypothetical protein
MTSPNFTKELRSQTPSTRVSLSKLLRPTPAAGKNDATPLNDAAALIKALHRTGGGPLRKKAQ